MSMNDEELSKSETVRLISSEKVSGTAVYGADRDKIGSVEKLMIDKTSGKVSYAVMSFGGFLGIGEHYHPLPWNQLTYDAVLDGYVVALSRDQLENVPSYAAGDEPDWESREWRSDMDRSYRGIPMAPGMPLV